MTATTSNRDHIEDLAMLLRLVAHTARSTTRVHTVEATIDALREDPELARRLLETR